MPKVSIIVPNYNYALYLPKRMESILGQTFSDYEVILLDDCSTDGSQKYLEQYAGTPKVSHIVINAKNTGNPFSQWEKGIALAKGEYIWIAESDDYADSTFLEKMTRLLDDNPDAGYAMCGSHLIDSDGNPIDDDYDKWPTKETKKPFAYKYDSEEYIKHFLLWYNAAYNASMIVFRKKLLGSIDMDFQATRYCGDWLFWIKLAEISNVIVLHERLNYFRRHPKSVTISSDGSEKQMREKLLIFRYLWENHNFCFYRNALSRGYVYKEITRAKMSNEKKREFFKKNRHLGVDRPYYFLERTVKILNQLFPFVPAPKYDYIEGHIIMQG